MAHPHRHAAHSSSKEKFRAITGHGGGGHAHAGGSHLKKAGTHGVLKTWSGKHKAHVLEDKISGHRPKARADKFARGGRAEGGSAEHHKGKSKKKHGDVNVAIVMPHHGQGAGAPPPPPGKPVTPPPTGGAPPPPMGGGAGPGMGAGPAAGLGGGGGNPGGNPLAALSNAGGMGPPIPGLGKGFKRGGHAKHTTGKAVGDTESKGYDMAHWRGYAEGNQPAHHAKGGRASLKSASGMTAGASSGVGRLEQAKITKRRFG